MYVSVVIPCYNVAEWVADALNSALAQDYPLLEIIAVDNGSTDDTLAVLYAYARQHPQRIRVLQEARRGAPAARNTGWRAARGQWIQFLDADDVLLPGKISRQMGLVGGDSPFIAGAYIYLTSTGKEQIKKPELNVWVELGHNLGITSSNLFNRDYLEQIGGWRDSLPVQQDFDLMFRILQRHDGVIFDPITGVVVRERAGSISALNEPYSLRLQLALRLKVLRYLQRYKNEVWIAHGPELKSRLLFYLRGLATTRQNQAANFYSHLIGADKPKGALFNASFPSVYRMAFNLLGFRRAERLRLCLRAVLPARCRAWARRWKV